MALTPDQLDDFVELTLRSFTRKKWVDISLPLQTYIFASRMFEKNKTMEYGGPFLDWKVQYRNTGSFQDAELYSTDITQVKDLMTNAEVPWSKQSVNFSYDIDEDGMQSDREKIISIVKERNHSMYNDFFDGMESRLWTKPASSSTDPRKPFGIPYWVVQNSTAAFGFNGGNPDGFSGGAGGIDQGTHARWANGTFTYASIDDNDFLAKWSEATRKCRFKAPHRFPELGGGGPVSEYEFFTTFPVLEQVERLLRASNDNHGSNAGYLRGDVMYQGVPLTWVPELTDSTADGYAVNNPIYGINWKCFKWFFKKGASMRRSPPQIQAGSHDVRNVFLDSWGNFKAINRRDLFVGYDINL